VTKLLITKDSDFCEKGIEKLVLRYYKWADVESSGKARQLIGTVLTHDVLKYLTREAVSNMKQNLKQGFVRVTGTGIA
jgi:hypothetical protein